MARIEAGSLSVDPAPVDLAKIVDEARNRFLGAGGSERLNIDLEPDLPEVMADRRRIAQVLGNLLSNAVRHSPDGSPVGVSAVRDGSHAVVFVSDQGRGIPADMLPHLFRKFSQVGGAGRDGGATGSGLRLAICNGIADSRVSSLGSLSLPAPTPPQFRWHSHSCRRQNAQLFVNHLPFVAKRRAISAHNHPNPAKYPQLRHPSHGDTSALL